MHAEGPSGNTLCLAASPVRREAALSCERSRRIGYSATTAPEPPISFGKSFIFGSPSFILSFVS